MSEPTNMTDNEFTEHVEKEWRKTLYSNAHVNTAHRTAILHGATQEQAAKYAAVTLAAAYNEIFERERKRLENQLTFGFSLPARITNP